MEVDILDRRALPATSTHPVPWRPDPALLRPWTPEVAVTPRLRRPDWLITSRERRRVKIGNGVLLAVVIAVLGASFAARLPVGPDGQPLVTPVVELPGDSPVEPFIELIVPAVPTVLVSERAPTPPTAEDAAAPADAVAVAPAAPAVASSPIVAASSVVAPPAEVAPPPVAVPPAEVAPPPARPAARPPAHQPERRDHGRGRGHGDGGGNRGGGSENGGGQGSGNGSGNGGGQGNGNGGGGGGNHGGGGRDAGHDGGRQH